MDLEYLKPPFGFPDPSGWPVAVQLRDQITGWKVTGFGEREGERWYWLAGMYDPAGPTARAYRDGHLQTAQSELSDALTAPSPPYNWFWYVGVENNTNNPLDGWIDEVRVSESARSADWKRVQYLSMTDSFITHGPIVTR